MNKNHPFHLVNFSPWPLLIALSIFSLMMGLIKWFHMYTMNLFLFSMIITLMIMFQWWRDVIRESTFQGNHTFKVAMGLRLGMILFIVSEILFFISFFWSFFHMSLSPSIDIGMLWPPKNIEPFNPLSIPLLNTMILLTSGISVTWAHHSMMENNWNQTFQSLSITVILGIYFSILQLFEYSEAPFTMADSIYGSIFFISTGFHGIHVIIGTIFLLMCLMRHYLNHFSTKHHLGLEMSIWYWHFVDIVWLFLYISVYWWGS